LSLAIFEVLESLRVSQRRNMINVLEDTYPYNKIFTEIRNNKLTCLTFEDLLSLLKYFGTTYQFGDNIFQKVGKLKGNKRINKKHFKNRKKISINGLLGLEGKLKQTSRSYTRYMLLLTFFQECNDIEIKWTIHYLVNKKKMKEVILCG